MSAEAQYMSIELIERWADEIEVPKIDPKNPEWEPTPVIPLDLSKEGYGQVFIKNEADTNCNQTGTIKDRLAWEIVKLHSVLARKLYHRIKKGTLSKEDLQRLKVPRFTTITSGNEGRALAEAFGKFDLLPPKLIVNFKPGDEQSEKLLVEMLKLRAEIYSVNLGDQALTAEDVLRITNNNGGINITSCVSIKPDEKFYDWFSHEVFNSRPTPTRVYLGRGSGRLMENLLNWQVNTAQNDDWGIQDPRLQVTAEEVTDISICGAEPENENTKADKLYAKFRPFMIIKDTDLNVQRVIGRTGEDTGAYQISEEYISEAYEILNRYGIETEYSGAAGLALYLQHFKEGTINAKDVVMVINTGKGLIIQK